MPRVRLAPPLGDGGRFALGNTEEHLIVEVLGVDERGAKADGPLRRHGERAGQGWVRASRDKSQYGDAQRRGNPCHLHVCESTGAMSGPLDEAFRALDKQSRLPTTHDSTVYGTARSSPRTFYAHHVAAHSAAVVFADAGTIHDVASSMSLRVTLGIGVIPPARVPSVAEDGA